MFRSHIKLAVLGAVLSGFFLAAPFTYASVAQYDVSTSTPTSNLNVNTGLGFFGQTLGTTLSGNLEFIALYLSGTFGGVVTLDVYEFSSDSYTSGTLVWRVQDTPTSNTVATAHIFATSTPYELDETKYYMLCWQRSNGAGNVWSSWGSPEAIAWPNGEARVSSLPCGTNTTPNIGGVEDYAFALNTNPPANWSQFASTTIYVPGLSTTTVASYCAGNVIETGLCNVFTFLFVPSDVSISQLVDRWSLLQDKIPFSYYNEFYSYFSALTATTTENVQTFSINLSLVDFASSTAFGPILPSSFDFFSKETISRYISEDTHDLIFLLMEAVIWLAVAFHIYNRVVPRRAIT